MIVTQFRTIVATLLLLSAPLLADDPPTVPPPTNPIPQLQFINPDAPLPPGDLTPGLLLDGISIFNLYDPAGPLPTGIDPLVLAVMNWVDAVEAFHAPSTLFDLLFPPPPMATVPPPSP